MDILAGMNPQQQIALQHGRGPALVLAGAGSGKTRVITHRIAYLIRNQAARPEQILAVTFTNKAADEMRERIHTILGPNRSAEPLISTFHSFCVRLLRREIQQLGYKRDFSIYDTDDQRRQVKLILQELKLREADLPARAVLSRISLAKNHGVGPGEFARKFPTRDADEVALVYATYEQKLRQANALDFDDLLLKAVELLDSKQKTREYYSDFYRYILVDEYQDTNRPQYELLCLLTCRHKNLFVVGDEDQSIYGFRGADIQNILRFEQDFPGTKVIKLEQNYRSTNNILRAAGTLVERNTERKGKTLWTQNVGGDVVTCRVSRSAHSEAEWVTDQIRSELQEMPDWRIGVLYRANFLSRNYEDVLTQRGIPYRVVGSVAFFGRMEVKDMLAYLRVVFNPEDDVALLRILNTPPRGIGDKTIEILTRVALERSIPLTTALREVSSDPKLAGRAAGALRLFQDQLERWTAMRDDSTIGALLQTIASDIRYREMLQKDESFLEAENRMSNIEELLRAATESGERGETVFEFLDRAALSSELDKLDPNARVTLMTLHSAKGLEFDVVFLVGLEEGLFPHQLSMGSAREIEEERRLCYVGITRARRKLYLAWTPNRRSFGGGAGFSSQPSRFLSELPAELVQTSEERGFYSHKDPEPYRKRRPESDSGRVYDYDEDYHRGASSGEPDELPEAEYPKSLSELRSYLQKKQADPKPAPASEKVLKEGVRVRHQQFGDGIVVSRERVGQDIKLTVHFSRVGRKTLIEKYARLEAL
jgi:DNA helicase-2/ATP-dependent DNA helicase PcrA